MTDVLTRQVIAGAILAGGNASRMGGIAKGAIQTESGVSIIEHLINEFHLSGIHHVVILANDPRPYRGYGVEILEDVRTGIGPLGGIETGLVHLSSQCDGVMYVPCDMPNLTSTEMLILKEAFLESETSVVYAEISDIFCHPLCTVVHNGLIKEISSAIDRGEKTVHKLWKQLGAKGIRFGEGSHFFNLNSILEAEQWRKGRDEKADVC